MGNASKSRHHCRTLTICPPHFCPATDLTVIAARAPTLLQHSSAPRMAVISTTDPVSRFKDGKLKPGIYRIQNIVGQTYVDTREHTRELCCRPVTVLEGRGLVSSCPHLRAFCRLIVTFSGKFSLLVPDILYAEYSFESHLSLFRTEQGNVARIRHA